MICTVQVESSESAPGSVPTVSEAAVARRSTSVIESDGNNTKLVIDEPDINVPVHPLIQLRIRDVRSKMYQKLQTDMLSQIEL